LPTRQTKKQNNSDLKMSVLKKSPGLNPLVETRDVVAIKNKTGNLYESIAVMSRRANQISVNTKEELQRRLEEFSTYTDTMEEVAENKEQIEISRTYERMANSALQATAEFQNDEIFYRKGDLYK
jgi:DNA-directed RNA polymerase subunit K/omega